MHPALLLAKFLTVGLGFLIAWKAFTAYRRSGNKPYVFVTIGFVFVSLGAVLEGILLDEFGLSVFLAGSVQTAMVAVGLFLVIYSLYGRPETTSP